MLYDEARAEGGRLVVYAGGDAPEQAAMDMAGFTEPFPDIDIEMSVDLSKYHDARIDAAHLRGDNRVDVVHLQTLHDDAYWKQQGLLLPFKPEGFDQLPDAFKDADGADYPLFVFAFSNVVDTAVIPADRVPRAASDYLRPDLKGRIVLVYPHDADAVLYRFDRIIARHGIDWLLRLQEQDIQGVRGSATPLQVIKDGKADATFASFYSLNPPETDTMRMILPAQDYFQSWYQPGAILAAPPHPAAAKLYMSFRLSGQAQETSAQWPGRMEVQIPNWKPIWDYPNTDPAGFRDFMADRARAERLRGIMVDIIGPEFPPRGPKANSIPPYGSFSHEH